MTELPIEAGQRLRDDERRLGRFTAAKQLSEPLASKHPGVTCAEQLRTETGVVNTLLVLFDERFRNDRSSTAMLSSDVSRENSIYSLTINNPS